MLKEILLNDCWKVIMKNILIAIVLGFGFSSAPVTLPDVAGGGFTNSALAQGHDVCKGQKETYNWKFAASNSKGEKVIFGPYKCKNVCTQMRANEAGKVKWVVIGACESSSF